MTDDAELAAAQQADTDARAALVTAQAAVDATQQGLIDAQAAADAANAAADAAHRALVLAPTDYDDAAQKAIPKHISGDELTRRINELATTDASALSAWQANTAYAQGDVVARVDDSVSNSPIYEWERNNVNPGDDPAVFDPAQWERSASAAASASGTIETVELDISTISGTPNLRNIDFYRGYNTSSAYSAGAWEIISDALGDDAGKDLSNDTQNYAYATTNTLVLKWNGTPTSLGDFSEIAFSHATGSTSFISRVRFNLADGTFSERTWSDRTRTDGAFRGIVALDPMFIRQNGAAVADLQSIASGSVSSTQLQQSQDAQDTVIALNTAHRTDRAFHPAAGATAAENGKILGVVGGQIDYTDAAVFGSPRGDWDVSVNAGLPAPIVAGGDWWVVAGVTPAETDAGGKSYNGFSVKNGDVFLAKSDTVDDFAKVSREDLPPVIAIDDLVNKVDAPRLANGKVIADYVTDRLANQLPVVFPGDGGAKEINKLNVYWADETVPTPHPTAEEGKEYGVKVLDVNLAGTTPAERAAATGIVSYWSAVTTDTGVVSWLATAEPSSTDFAFTDNKVVIAGLAQGGSGDGYTVTGQFTLPAGNKRDIDVKISQALSLAMSGDVATSGGVLTIKNSSGATVLTQDFGHRRHAYNNGYRAGDIVAYDMDETVDLPAGIYDVEFAVTNPKSIGGHREPNNTDLTFQLRTYHNELTVVPQPATSHMMGDCYSYATGIRTIDSGIAVGTGLEISGSKLIVKDGHTACVEAYAANNHTDYLAFDMYEDGGNVESTYSGGANNWTSSGVIKRYVTASGADKEIQINVTNASSGSTVRLRAHTI